MRSAAILGISINRSSPANICALGGSARSPRDHRLTPAGKQTVRSVLSRHAEINFSAIIARMKFFHHELFILLSVFVTCLGQAAIAETTSPSTDAQALVKQGQKLNSEGKQDDALRLYKQALEKSPNLYEAHLESGVALDLKGEYAEARKHLQKAIDVAPVEQKNRALRVMAFSYAFEGNSGEAEKYEKQVFDVLVAKPDFEAAAGVANELARIKLESGDIDGAAS